MDHQPRSIPGPKESGAPRVEVHAMKKGVHVVGASRTSSSEGAAAREALSQQKTAASVEAGRSRIGSRPSGQSLRFHLTAGAAVWAGESAGFSLAGRLSS